MILVTEMEPDKLVAHNVAGNSGHDGILASLQVAFGVAAHP